MNKEREEKTVKTVYGISKLSNNVTTWVPEGRRDAIQTWHMVRDKTFMTESAATLGAEMTEHRLVKSGSLFPSVD